MNIEFVNYTKIRYSRRAVGQWVEHVVRELKKRRTRFKKKFSHYSLAVVFVPEKRSQRLNSMYRKKNRPTDVLSFNGTYDGHLGDLVLCPKVIKKQAKENGESFEREINYMILHGILHLLGYDHEKNKRQAQIMFSLQDLIFQRLYKKP